MKLFQLIFCLIATITMYAGENMAITEKIRKKYGVAYFRNIDRFRHFSYYSITKQNLEGACDSLGNEIIPPIYDSCSGLFDYFTTEKNGKCTIIDQNGKVLISETNNMIFAVYHEDYIICISNGEFKFDEDNYVAKVKKNGKWGVFSLKEKKFTVPVKYEYINDYGEGLFSFCVGGKISDLDTKPKGGKWGYINTSGEIIVDAIYDNVNRFKDGYAQVTNGKSVTLIPNPLQSENSNMPTNLKPREAPIANFTNENLFIIIAGNNDYASDISSNSAVNDCELFYKYCVKSLGCPQNNIHYITNATYANFQKLFSQIREISEVYEGEAKIILYFSGLGATATSGERYILPIDVELSNIASTGISLNDIIDLFNEINTIYSLAIIDAPFNGLDKTEKSFLSDRGVVIKPIKNTNLQKNSFIFLGAGENGYAYNLKDENVSLFTNSILESMDTNMNKMPLLTFINKVTKLTKQLSLDFDREIQIPQLYRNGNLMNSENIIRF